MTQSGVGFIFKYLSHLSLVHLFSRKILFAMANQCPICSKQFVSKIALRNHTGTKDATLCRAHMCRKCEQKFCSEEAMVQHHDAPSHRVMFSCDVCKKPFASKQAMKQHKKSSLHARTLTRENLAAGYAASASLNPKKPGS